MIKLPHASLSIQCPRISLVIVYCPRRYLVKNNKGKLYCLFLILSDIIYNIPHFIMSILTFSVRGT